MTKWRTLALATVSFNVSFLVWFSFAPFTGPIGDSFGLSLAELGILASAAVWIVPFGRVATGWLTDRYGATRLFAVALGCVGAASAASAFADSYGAFFALRLVVAAAGITFVIGIQHVSQWFPEEQLGTAEGVYAGIGNAGAAAGALVLPRAFGTAWSGPLFETGWRAAFFYVGVVAAGLGVVYYLLGEDAATEERAKAAADGATLEGLAHTATRYGVVALAFGYLLSFGMEISMNGWLPTYFREGFGANLVLASTFAAAFSLSSGCLRPLSGYASDRLARAEIGVLPVFDGRYREQWTFLCMCYLLVALVGLTLVGRTGRLVPTVAACALVGLGCGFTSGAIFAQVPATFPDRSGAAAGIVGGFGTIGGVAFPLVFSWTASQGYVHASYALVAVLVVPIVLLNAYVYRPTFARRATADGLLSFSDGEVASSDD
jgi:NNP family nitrate/nitrite transporter-like MFS transporter